jgi:predicted O-methyltransferase YrrM
MDYRYTQTWFLFSEIKHNLLSFVNTEEKNTILEIGSYEGLSSVFFADNLLNHPESSLMCVDPFLNTDNNDHSILLQNNEELNFDYNIKKCKNAEKINVQKITSDDFFVKNDKTYNIIYIDGSHEIDYIMRDMENSFKVLEKNGIMWMDDYGGGDGIRIKTVVDNFLKKYQHHCEVIHKGYQLAIKKTL